jgi:hypothetical protein
MQNLHQSKWEYGGLGLVTMETRPLLCDSWTHTCATMGLTERRGRTVNTPVSYFGSSGFKFRPGDRIPWLGILYFSSVPPEKCHDSPFN